MTFTIPRSRNSFHPAWLLLLVPPLVSLGQIWWQENPPVLVGQIFRLILMVALVGPILGMRSGPVGDRAQRLLKEVRALLPGCLIALLIPGLLGLSVEREAAGIAVWCYGFGCVLMGGAAFGAEFEQRTMGTLLSQPLSRGTVFAEKVGVLMTLLGLSTVNLLLSLALVPAYAYGAGDMAQVLLLPVFALCSGPFYSLITRSTLAALIFTVTMPMIAYPFGVLGLETIHRLGHPDEILPDAWVDWLLLIGTPLYLAVMAALGWRSFRNLEVRDGGAGGRSSASLHPLSRPVDSLLRRLFPAAGGTAQLIRKELRLHVVPWLVASIMVGLWLLWLALRHFAHKEGLREALNEPSTLIVFAALLGSLIVVGTGAACVAEERELGTLEWQLTQPVSVRKQWWVKVAVTLTLSFVLGVGLPALLLWLGFDPALSTSKNGGFFLTPLGWPSSEQPVVVAGLILMVSVTSIYASSISRNTMKATAVAAGIAAGFAGFFTLIGMATSQSLQQGMFNLPEDWRTEVAMPAWAPSVELLKILAAVCLAAIPLLYVAMLLWLGGRNCRRQVVPGRDVARQLGGVTLGLLVGMGILCGGFVQLALLRRQVDVVEVRQSQRRSDFYLVRQMAKEGKIAPGVYEQFSLPTNAEPAQLTDAIRAARGPNGVAELYQLLNPPAKRTKYSMDPVLARRYGLVPGTNSNASPPPAAGAPKAYSMDPVMARRYGLIPQTNPPATGNPVPAPVGK
ncbi:MAG TPA: ABC transporter permease subunit [Candidatus Limnocylindria bacterium]|nr:ABC transporter permease subunit [Candidatus Limnocylindria bacterium]